MSETHINFPNWSNPFIGLPALVSASIEAYDEEGAQLCRDALRGLGRFSGTYLMDAGVLPINANAVEIATFATRVLRNDGIASAGLVESTPARASIAIPDDPHLGAYDLIGAPRNLVDVLVEWDRGILEVVNPDISFEVERDAWRGDGAGQWTYEAQSTPARRDVASAQGAEQAIPLEHQGWVNGLVRTYAVINAVVSSKGDAGEAVLKAAYRRLGEAMVEEFVARGIARMGCSAHEWGKVSDDIAIVNGLTNEPIGDQQHAHTTKMPTCPAYAIPLRLMNAPRDICEIPMNWDNAEMDVVNPAIMMKVPRCTHRGDAYCVYSISPKDYDPATSLPA